MAKNFIGLGSLRYSSVAAVGLILVGCSAADTAHEAPGAASTEEDLIGGVPAASARLNAVGVLGIEYSYPDIGYTYYQAQCTGTLVSSNTVLTSAGCAMQLEYGYFPGDEVARPSFGIGPDGNAPARTFEVADIEYAPSTIDYADLAVVHLAETITDVAPLALAPLGAEAVGETFAAIGYGPRTQFYDQSGERRVGTATVNAIEGLLYELVFGSFEAFYEFHTGMLPGGRSRRRRRGRGRKRGRAEHRRHPGIRRSRWWWPGWQARNAAVPWRHGLVRAVPTQHLRKHADRPHGDVYEWCSRRAALRYRPRRPSRSHGGR